MEFSSNCRTTRCEICYDDFEKIQLTQISQLPSQAQEGFDRSRYEEVYDVLDQYSSFALTEARLYGDRDYYYTLLVSLYESAKNNKELSVSLFNNEDSFEDMKELIRETSSMSVSPPSSSSSTPKSASMSPLASLSSSSSASSSASSSTSSSTIPSTPSLSTSTSKAMSQTTSTSTTSRSTSMPKSKFMSLLKPTSSPLTSSTSTPKPTTTTTATSTSTSTSTSTTTATSTAALNSKAKPKSTSSVSPPSAASYHEISKLGLSLECNPDHAFCGSCLEKYIETQINNHVWPVQCPMDDCQMMISLDIVGSILGQRINRWHNLGIENAITKRIYCPNSKCNILIDAGDAGSENNSSKSWRVNVRCPYCSYAFCALCLKDGHAGLTCEQAKGDQSDRLFETLAVERHWKRCPGCGQMVEKNGGCNHMTCRCTKNFNYA